MRSEIIKKTLNNNMRFIHIKNKSKRITIELTVKVGSQDETSENAGTSHFLEHMIWQGSEIYNKKTIRAKLKKLDALHNASCSFYSTSFYIKGPRRHYEKFLTILADIIKNPLFDEEVLKKEKKIILNEYKRAYENINYEMNKKTNEYLFKDNNFNLSPIGLKKNIKNMTVEQLKEFYKKYYVANNIIITINGDLENPEHLIEQLFTLRKGRSNKNKKIITTKLEKNKIIKLKGDIKTPKIKTTYVIPEVTSKEFVYARIINHLLNSGIDINLSSSIRENLALSYSIFSYMSTLGDFGFLTISTTSDLKNLDLLLSSINKEFDKFKTLKKGELNKAKQKLVSYERKSDAIPYFLQEKEIKSEIFNHSKFNEKQVAIIREATVEDLNNVIDKYFKNCLITIMEPRNK